MPPRSRTDTLQRLNHLSSGRLIPALRSWRAHGDSFATCARQLDSEFGVDVDPSTVRRWLLELPEEAPAAS